MSATLIQIWISSLSKSFSIGVLLHASPIHLQICKQDMPGLRLPQPPVPAAFQLHDTMFINFPDAGGNLLPRLVENHFFESIPILLIQYCSPSIPELGGRPMSYMNVDEQQH